jgi:RimJ/RimL family protein N-acetyltransferase
VLYCWHGPQSGQIEGCLHNADLLGLPLAKFGDTLVHAVRNMNAEDLLRTQLKLEGLRVDGAGYLRRFRDMPGESGPPARIVAVDYGHKQSVLFGSGINPVIEQLILELPVRDLMDGNQRVFDIIGKQTKPEGHAQYWTYTTSEAGAVRRGPLVQRLSSQDERLREFSAGFFGIEYDGVFAVIAKGTVASAAASSREDGTAAELWVYTHPDYRRQGLATKTATAWLRSMVARGLIPFYSHLRDNNASRRLSESLQLSLCFVLSCYP